MTNSDNDPVILLLIEDSPSDIALIREVLTGSQVTNQLIVVTDGEEAMAYLKGAGREADNPRPDLILLDLNLPKKDGREVLREIKTNPELLSIPVVVMTTSKAEEDVVRSYRLHANCYITKPVDFDQFSGILRSIEDFWFSTVRLPRLRE